MTFMESLSQQLDRMMKICRSLQECLDNERTALIHFQMEEVLRNNIIKETAIANFVEEKKKLQALLKAQIGVSQLSQVMSCLSGEDATAWSEKYAEWETVWARTKKLCVRNREFLALSQKNLEMIQQNLLDLFGRRPTYDGHGNKVKKQDSGRVVEAKA